MAFSKLRPVGSRVYPPVTGGVARWPWGNEWTTNFMVSGTAALSLAVALACSRTPEVDRPEVILPAYGCPDLVAATIAQGAIPRLVDLAPNTPFMDLDALGAALTSSTVAIVAVNFLGLPERLAAISAMALERGIMLIEDSAQRFPPLGWRESRVDCMVLSFGRGKPMNAMGGGALVVHEAHMPALNRLLQALPVAMGSYRLKDRIKRRVFNTLLSRYLYVWLERLPFLHLGETRFKPLSHLSQWAPPAGLLEGALRAYNRRPDWAARYDRELAFLADKGWVLLSSKYAAPAPDASPLLRYALLAPTQEIRNDALDRLNSAGIGANAFYGLSLPATAGTASHLEPGALGAFPSADDFARRLITLPTHEDTCERDILQVTRILRDVLA